MLHVPTVSEISGKERRSCDVFSRLLNDRIILVNGEITDELVPVVCAQMLFLDAQDATKPIYLYINSRGGSVTAGLAIYDTMHFVNSSITTLCMGSAASMGAFLLAAGTHGQRYSLPHSQIMIHQPSCGISGQATDIEIHARQILYYKRALNELLAQHTGRTEDKIREMTERDRFLTPQEAVELGLIDGILTKKNSLCKESQQTTS